MRVGFHPLSRIAQPWRRAIALALIAAAVAGAVVGALAATTGATPPKGGLARAKGVGDAVALVRRSFGDGRIASASVEGSLLSVKLSVPSTADVAARDTLDEKAIFEARVLAHSVADWMRYRGKQPITTVRYRNTDGRVIFGEPGQDVLESDPNVSPLVAGTCKSVAKTAAKAATATASLTLVSARTLPWLNGTCVFRFRTSDPAAGSAAAASVLQRIIQANGPPNLRPWFFELDGQRRTAHLGGASWMPDSGGSTWARPGLTYPLPHE